MHCTLEPEAKTKIIRSCNQHTPYIGTFTYLAGRAPRELVFPLAGQPSPAGGREERREGKPKPAHPRHTHTET